MISPRRRRSTRVRAYLAVGIASLGVSLALSIVPASAVAVSYNQTTPGFNGTSYSPGRTKVVEDIRGEIWSTSVGANYQLDAGMTANGSGFPIVQNWVRIDDGTYGELRNSFNAGSVVHLAMSSDVVTPVSVNAVGTWDAH